MTELSRRTFFKLGGAAVVATAVPEVMQQVITAVAADDGGWLPCEGQVLDRFMYPELFAALGTNYGGDGISAFRLPDFTGEFKKQSPFPEEFSVQQPSPPVVESVIVIKVRKSKDDGFPVGYLVDNVRMVPAI